MGASLTRNPSGPNLSRGGDDGLLEPAIRNELERLLASACFREAEGLRRFLRYAVEHTVAGEGDQLKEYRLGLEVFDRDSSFDPRLDPVVRMAARRLRTKLDEYYQTEGRDDPICIAIPKGGYAAAFDSNTPRQPSSENEPPNSGRFRLLLAAGCVLVFFAAGAALYWVRARHIPPPAPSRESSIAVLPFLNLTGNQDDEYLSDGLADELTGGLSRLPGLRVTARTSAFKFKGKAEDVRLIGSQPNVASLLEGSVQRRGEQLRITVQLIRASDGSHIWAETYDREANNSFALEDEITQAVTHALRVRLAAQPSPASRAVNAEAFDLYLRGRYWWSRRTPPAVWKAVAYFNQALEKEPLYAQAYLGLADAYTVLGFNDQAPADEMVSKARAAAEQALRLDDSLSEAHRDLAAAVLYHDWNFELARQEFQRAVQLNPNDATAHQWYGLQLMHERKFDDSLREFSAAQRLDPLSLMITLDVGQAHYYSGRQEAAIQQAQKVLAEDPDFAMAHDLLGMAYERQRRLPEALGEFQRYLELSGGDPDALMRLGVTYADALKPGQALALAKKMERVLQGGHVPSYDIAVVYAALGKKELAFEWLRQAIAQHESSCLLLAVDPAFESVHSDPRFEESVRKVGLVVSGI